MWFILLFVGLPVLELAVILKINEIFGLAETLLLIVLTGIAGATMAKLEGLRVLGEAQRDLVAGNMPAPRMLDGVMILLAAALLVTPGLITDVVGFLLLMPPVRVVIRQYLRRWLEKKLRDGSASMITWHW